MENIRTFTTCVNDGARHFDEITPDDLERLKQRSANPTEVFGLQVTESEGMLKIVGIVIAFANKPTVYRNRPGSNIYNGKLFSIGNDCRIMKSGHAGTNEFLAHICAQY